MPRPEADRLPPVVALANRGDPPTMEPARLRQLAAAHRVGFGGFSAAPDAVLLHQPYLGSQEIVPRREQFARHRETARKAGVALDAVQAEFLREFLLGPEATARLHEPGTDRPALDPGRIDAIAHACKAAWDGYRERS